MFVSDILNIKGTDVVSTSPNKTAAETVSQLKNRRIGTILVLGDARQIVGVISERDIVRGIATHGERALQMQVRDLMTSEVITCKLNDTIHGVMKVMTDHAFRHLPVVEEGELKGLISITDVVRCRVEDLERQIKESKTFDPAHG